MAAENSAGSPKKRGRPFPAGVSPNPGGRPKKLDELAASIREFDYELRDKLLNIVRTGSDKDAREAIKLLWSYAHGLPRQIISGEDGNPIKVEVGVLDMLRKLASL